MTKSGDVLVAVAVILGLAACAVPIVNGPEALAQQQAQREVYCAAKAALCATPSDDLSEDEKTIKTLACAVNTVCMPALPASAPVLK